MVIIRNIKRNDSVVEFDYYPENEQEKGSIIYNYNTKTIISHIKTIYDDVMDYAGHAIDAIERYIEQNKDFPSEICEMWY